LTTYICTNNLFLLFDNTTGMTHLKIEINLRDPYDAGNFLAK